MQIECIYSGAAPEYHLKMEKLVLLKLQLERVKHLCEIRVKMLHSSVKAGGGKKKKRLNVRLK